MLPYEDLALSNRFLFPAYETVFREVTAKGRFILSEQVSVFESRFAQRYGTDYGIGVANGLDALTLILKAMDLPPGSEVIVPSNTYIATVLAVIHSGHKPVLAEPDPGTMNISAAGITPCITSSTKAILLVHLYGKCCDMDGILELAAANDIPVIEDCAQAHDATYKGSYAGSFGLASAFSFYPTKNLGALGDGGAVLTSDDALNEKIRTLRNYGSSKKYHNDVAGYNSRLDELQAAFLNIKLEHLDRITQHKRTLAALYLNGLKKDFILPVTHPDFGDVFHIFCIRHPERDRLQQYLAENGVGTEVHYPVPPHRQKALAPYFEGRSYPVSEEIHRTVLSLPCSMAHSQADIEMVIRLMNRF